MNEILQEIISFPQVDYSFRLLVAVFCGALLGMERSFRSKHAGLRTHAILAGGAALFMILSKYAFFDLVRGAGLQGFDPTVIACYIIDGTGFLGAGIIFNKVDQDTISGLTTAAGIWATAAIGMACGSGLMLLGVLTTLLFLLIPRLVSFKHVYIAPIRILYLKVQNTPELRKMLKAKQEEYRIQVVSARYGRTRTDGLVSIYLQIRTPATISFEDVYHFMKDHPEITEISL